MTPEKKPASPVILKRIGIIIGTVALTLAGSLFYFNARPESKRVLILPEDVPPVQSEAFERLLEAYAGNRMVDGNSITPLKNGDEIFPAKLDAIAGAEASICLEIYEFWGENVAGRITDALIERAENGVRVHVLLDYFGSIPADPDKFTRMEDAGIELFRWREASWYHSGRFNHRTHRKLMILDGRVGFIGGANMGDDWWKTDGGGRPKYRDNHFKFTGPVVSQLQAAFMDNWLRAANEILLSDTYFPEPEPAGDHRAQVIISSPSDGQKRIRTFLLLAFGAARESIFIQTAYFYPDPIIKQSLKDAVQRGVEVKLIVPGEKTGENIVRFASRNRWGPLLEAGIKLFEYEPTRFHSKLFIIDDHLVSLGSTNFDNRSFRINDEANVNILCSDFGSRMRQLFDQDLESSEKITYETWKSRPWWERGLGIIGNAIGPQL
ncbi:MAG: cardiolipin synthase B [Verrucomicrobia bacterium]|nr:cardiolipin synthase B [Verrucomicrobiota bacterium]MCH8526458.1 phospholipase D-like domain-containing protein [Kiritimatiellia bacterium]